MSNSSNRELVIARDIPLPPSRLYRAWTDSAFAALAEGGEVRMPLGKTFWSPRFGMLVDRFGIGWMVSVVS